MDNNSKLTSRRSIRSFRRYSIILFIFFFLFLFSVFFFRTPEISYTAECNPRLNCETKTAPTTDQPIEHPNRGRLNNQSVVNPFNHELCAKVYTDLSKRVCHLNNFLIKEESVEIQIVRAFSPILDSLCVDYNAINRRSSTRANYATAFIDIGVNDGEDVAYWHKRFGAYPSPCASSSNPENYNIARFFLFEPQQNYSLMIRNYIEKRFRANMNVNDTVFFPAAIGLNSQHRQFMNLIGTGEQGSVVLDSSSPSSGKSKRALKKLKNKGTFKVEILSLQRVLWESLPPSLRSESDIVDSSLLPPIMFMKVDCEGADATILKEANDLLVHHKIDLIMFEMNFMVGNFAVKYGDAAEVMEKAGYRLYLIGVWKGEAVKYNHPEHRSAGGRAINYGAFEINSAFLGAVEPRLETVIAISPKLVRKMEGMVNSTLKQQWNQAAHEAASEGNTKTEGIEKVDRLEEDNWASYQYRNRFWSAIGGKPLPKSGLWKSECFLGQVVF